MSTSPQAHPAVAESALDTAPMVAPNQLPPQGLTAISPGPVADQDLHSEAEIEVPEVLRNGVLMMKVSAKRVGQRVFVLNAERGQITWPSKKGGVLNIETIRELRFGSAAREYRNQFGISAEHEPHWTSIVYLAKGKYKMLHVVALSSAIFKAWKETLERVFELRKELLGGLNHMRKRQSVWLRQHWVEADSGGDAKLSFDEIVALCRRLNIAVSTDDIRVNFDIADKDKRGTLDFPDFQRFVKLMTRRTDIDAIFAGLTDGAAVLSEESFCKFMTGVQKSIHDPATLETIYHKFSDEGTKKMTVEGFTGFLHSGDNPAFSDSQTAVMDDMTLPLCDYYISSSHNTYLVGNQLKGDSTAEGYIRALQQGARSVELDCWDGDNGEPVVYHGLTLTSKLPVSQALTAISKYAFVASPYPVVLSVEVHCDQAQQTKLAQLLETCLGSALVHQKIGTDKDAPIEVLPSPEDLKHRILLKAKNHFVSVSAPEEPKEITTESDISTTTTSESSSNSSDSDLKRRISSAGAAFSNRFKRLSATGTSSSNSPTNSTSAKAEKPKKPPMSAALAALIVYTVGVKARGFNKLTKYAPEHVLSIGERTAGKLAKQARGADLIAHTRGHVTRTYPGGTRVSSSNYLPMSLWALGAQLVACNWQTFDLGMEINSAFFNRNGRCGYILKPECLRTKSKDKEAAIRLKSFVLDIDIVCGQQLPRLKEESRNVDPFVEVGVLIPGKQFDSAYKRKTKVVKGNGFNPIFNDNFQIPFECPGGMLELCFLRFVVGDGQDDDVELARYCISLASLQPGYRHVPLYDELGQQHLFASLFVRSSVTAI